MALSVDVKLRLVKAVDDAKRLKEFADDPVIAQFFARAREALIELIEDASRPADEVAESIAMLRALSSLHRALHSKLNVGRAAERKLEVMNAGL